MIPSYAKKSDPEPAAFAAAIAPHVDRLFIAGHQAARPLAGPIRQELGIAHFGVLIDLRRQLLSADGVTVDQASAIERYVDPAGIQKALQEHVEQGLLRRQDARFIPTERGREVLLRLTEALAQGIEPLWAGFAAMVREAAELAARVIDRGAALLPAGRYPAFTLQRTGFVPANAAAAPTLWTYLSTLRYLRADAHALAWSEAGLNRVQAVCLTALWQAPAFLTPRELPGGQSPQTEAGYRQALQALQERDWVQGGDTGWELSDVGRGRRELIEAATNEYNAPPLEALTATDREQLVRILGRLPEIGGMS